MSELLEPGHERGDMVTVLKAINEGWVIPEKALTYVPQAALKISQDESVPAIVRLKALELVMRLKDRNDERDNPKPSQGQSIAIQVNNGGVSDANPDASRSKYSSIIQRVRADRLAEEG